MTSSVRGGTPQPLLSVQDLCVEISTRQGPVRPVDRVSLDLAQGESLGVVGESGCGKTMTLRTIVGLLPRRARVTHGRILFRGTDLLSLSSKDLRGVQGTSISIIFQEPMTALNPVMSVGDQIAEGPRVRLGYGRKAARERALDLMRQVAIPDPVRRFGAYPHELSGGLRQRVMIALALACEPVLMLCDEPTTALDVTIQQQILELLSDLQDATGLSLIFVTHDLAIASQLCDRIAVMYAAQIVETGPVESVFTEPRHPYTLGLLRAIPDIDKMRDMLDSLQGSPPDLIAPPAGCRFHPRCAFAQQDCSAGYFPLAATGEDRASACIHWRQCRDSALSDPVIKYRS